VGCIWNGRYWATDRNAVAEDQFIRRLLVRLDSFLSRGRNTAMKTVMKTILISLSLFVLQMASTSSSFAATCSCAGVPLLSAMDTSSTQPGDLYLNYSTEIHEMSDLVQGSDEIRDETGLSRSSVSQVISASYGLADKWTVSGLISYIEHERSVGISAFSKNSSSGLGDGVLLLRYTPFYITPFSRHELSFGAGARLPIGKDDDGGLFTLSEDMQPSSGSVGEIYWSSYSYAFNQAATVQFNVSANYTINDDENSRKYVFGDEINFALGISQNIGSKFAYSAGLRYRQTTADERNSFEIPNTGGKWLDFVPGVQYIFNDKLSVGVSGRVPLVRDLDGVLQFTTSYSYAVNLSYAF